MYLNDLNDQDTTDDRMLMLCKSINKTT
jgi:hypothetical protein